MNKHTEGEKEISLYDKFYHALITNRFSGEGEARRMLDDLLQSERQKGRNERYCFREQRDKCSCKNEDSWETFWKEICTNEDGSINLEQIKKELSDFSHILEQIPTLYSQLTGGMLSNPNYWAEQIREVNNETIEQVVEEAEKEERQRVIEECITIIKNLETQSEEGVDFDHGEENMRELSVKALRNMINEKI